MASVDSLKTRRELVVGDKTYAYYSLRAAEEAGLSGVSRLPISMKVLLENLLRNEDGQSVGVDDLKALARFALFPGDDLTVAEVLRGPFCDVDEDSLFDLAGREKRDGLWRELKRRSDERPEWGRALNLLRALREAAV